MKLCNENAVVFFPDGNENLSRTTHLAISAHHDDIELMAMHGVLECFGKKDKWFTGVVVTDGAGSPRNGLYADYTDEEMKAVRVVEQKRRRSSASTRRNLCSVIRRRRSRMARTTK